MSTINPPTSSRDTTGQTRTQATESERAAAAAMLPMIWGLHISRAIYVTAELSIADLLADGPVSSTELARATRTHEPSLYRVLRLLAALGVLDMVEPRSFGLTALGDRLRSDAPACVRSWAIFLEALGGEGQAGVAGLTRHLLPALMAASVSLTAMSLWVDLTCSGGLAGGQ
jgi:hypothetical protein